MVFFFKQKTAYEMRISDWSSDVCSSDLDDRARLDSAGDVAAPEAGQDHAVHDGLRSGIGQAVRQVAPDHDPRLSFVRRNEQQDAAVRHAAAVGDCRGKAGDVEPAERGRGDDDQRGSASLVEGLPTGTELRTAVPS